MIVNYMIQVYVLYYIIFNNNNRLSVTSDDDYILAIT